MNFIQVPPRELYLKAKGYLNALKQNAELQSYVTSTGIFNALSKKRRIKVFDEEQKTHRISKEQKQKELKQLKERFE